LALDSSSFDGIRNLILQFENFSSAKEKEAELRGDRLRSTPNFFWPAFRKAKASWEARERVEAPRFNLIRLLELERLEKNHSKILADLLHPQGTHGQGTAFLTRFLNLIGLSRLKIDVTSPGATVEVSLESWITAGSRPDIVIRCAPSFFLIIENKIRHDEGIDSQGLGQLRRYRDWLDVQTKNGAAGEGFLVYLTIHPGKAEGGAEDRHLSYLSDISHWLKECIGDCFAPRVTQTLAQYLETIDDLRYLKKEESEESYEDE
jgi:PD-(D/E)XK nuclease superfamily